MCVVAGTGGGGGRAGWCTFSPYRSCLYFNEIHGHTDVPKVFQIDARAKSGTDQGVTGSPSEEESKGSLRLL